MNTLKIEIVKPQIAVPVRLEKTETVVEIDGVSPLPQGIEEASR